METGIPNSVVPAACEAWKTGFPWACEAPTTGFRGPGGDGKTGMPWSRGVRSMEKSFRGPDNVRGMENRSSVVPAA